jgi:putative tryptophan/tyrosine transport system substrate-binding protein
MTAIRRREFISLLSGAAGAWPLAVRAQQSAMPVIGFLSPAAPEGYGGFVAGLRQGLNEAGFIEGKNVAIEFRWAEGQSSRLPALAADLVRRPVDVIVPFAPAAALAAHAATKTIPIVFLVGADPVNLGLVASLNRPGGNVTGVSFLATDLGAKRLGLLREFLPKATAITMIVNPNNPATEPQVKDVQGAARTLGLTIYVLNARSESEIDVAVATHVERRSDALITGADAFFTSRHEQFVALSQRHAIPAIFPQREFTAAGGLMSYGTSGPDSARQTAGYVSRVLRGEKPSDLPVMQSTKFELVINLKTATTLGLTVPAGVLAIADEVIE